MVAGWGRWVPELSGQNVPHRICAGLTFLHDAAFTDIHEGLHFVSVCFFLPPHAVTVADSRGVKDGRAP